MLMALEGPDEPMTPETALTLSVTAWGWPEGLPGCPADPKPTDPAGALDLLRDAHAAQARLDTRRVHRSWWASALKKESPAVIRAVVATAPRSIRAKLAADLGVDPDLPAPPFSGPDPIRDCVLSLWCERLAAGPDPGDDDHLAVQVLARSDVRDLQSFLETIGLAKQGYLPDPPVDEGTLDHQMWLHFRNIWGEPSAAQVAQARRDAKEAGSEPRALGLITLGRLLAEAEPLRAQWAMQHLPMTMARPIREAMGLQSPALSRDELLGWERGVLDAAARVLAPYWHRMPEGEG
jgi:hypothetical protein